MTKSSDPLAGKQDQSVAEQVSDGQTDQLPAETMAVAPVDRYQIIDDWIVFPVIAVGVLITTTFPVFLAQELCLPVLNTLVIFPFFVMALRAGRTRRAVTLTLFWALCLVLSMTVLGLIFGGHAEQAVRGADLYRSQFIQWLADATPVTAAPALGWFHQLRDLVVFAVASALTAGLGGLFMLALALNVLSVTAAYLLSEALRPAQVLVLAWPIWSIARFGGALLLLAALAEPMATGNRRPAELRQWLPRRARLLGIAAGLILLGALLQLLLSPLYRSLLESGLGLS